MNWGMKIVLGLATFMLFIIAAGVYMVTKDTDSLVEEDYYEQSLNYDQVYNRKQNLLDDRAAPAIQLNSDTLVIIFTQESNRGTLRFQRNSDGSLDKKIPFYTTNNIFKLPTASFEKGNWNLEISWDANGKGYIANQSLNMQ